MKQENIIIRIDSFLKNEFREVCEKQGISMSGKVVKFIKDEVGEHRSKVLQKSVSDLLMGALGLRHYTAHDANLLAKIAHLDGCSALYADELNDAIEEFKANFVLKEHEWPAETSSDEILKRKWII